MLTTLWNLSINARRPHRVHGRAFGTPRLSLAGNEGDNWSLYGNLPAPRQPDKSRRPGQVPTELGNSTQIRTPAQRHSGDKARGNLPIQRDSDRASCGLAGWQKTRRWTAPQFDLPAGLHRGQRAALVKMYLGYTCFLTVSTAWPL